ncbi:MAG: ribose-5-phosphate isomerase RpiA [Salinispira sp.]
MTPNTNELKKQAAYRAVDDIIRSGSKVGLGTGSTARHVVHRLAEHLNNGRLKSVLTVATSNNTRELCRKLHIPVFSLNDSRIAGRLDYAIDGADEVSPMNDLIKGGGAAHLLEKIVAYSAEHFYVVVDESKLVTVLNRAFAVPLEIIPEAQASLIRVLEKERFSVRLRMIGQMDAGRDRSAEQRGAAEQRGVGAPVGAPAARGTGTPVLTDSRNRILDLFAPGREGMEKGGPYDPAEMESYFNSVPGIVESGLFTCPVRAVYIGAENGVVVRE